MSLTPADVDDIVTNHANNLLNNLAKHTSNPNAKYGVAVAFAYLTPGFQQCYCFGSADDQGNPVTEATIFSIGSLTKTFTAVLLADATMTSNVNNLDAVTKYIDRYLSGSPASATMQSITLWDLVRHTSGLPDATLSDCDGSGLFQSQPSWPPSDLIDFWKTYAGVTPNTCWQYSNLGFVTLGYALVAAPPYDPTYAELLQDVITKPLNLPYTSAYIPSGAPVAEGHHNGITVPVSGASDLKSCASDMYQWMLQNLLAPAQESSVLMAALAATTTPSTLGGLKNCDEKKCAPASMGMAWQVTPGSPQIIWKDGLTTLGGCSCWIGMVPASEQDGGMGIAILANGWVKNDKEKIDIIADTAGWHMLRAIYAKAVA